mgnify:CR=1 FL=1|nr:MAG TPA: hypothetical protein [Caudoviricetes sp.]
MDCPYIIRENIGFDHVREHGYYDPMEMAYDLTHDFASADVEVITRHAYNVVMKSGERLSDVDDETVFKMLSAGLPVKYVENARDGYIMYSRHESKPSVKVKRVGGITRAKASQQYANAIGPSVTPETRNFTVIVLYDNEVWVGSFYGENITFDFFERRAKNNLTVMLYKGNRLVCRAFNGVKEAQQ